VGSYPWIAGNEGEVHKWEPTYVSESDFKRDRKTRIIYKKEAISFESKEAEIKNFSLTGRKLAEFKNRLLFKPKKSGIYFYIIKNKIKLLKVK